MRFAWLGCAIGLGCSSPSAVVDGGAEGGDGNAQTDGGEPCPQHGAMLSGALPGATNVTLAAQADLDGDGRADLVAANDTGLTSYSASACGALRGGPSVLIGVKIISLAAAEIIAGGPMEIVALADDRTLYALGGSDLKILFSSKVMNLPALAAAVPVRMDLDGDHDIAAVATGYTSLLRVENTGTGWNVRTTVQLPGGITRLAAGPLGGNARDELLFLGGGLVEVVSVADFDFSDVRPLSNAVHGIAAFGDFDRDGKPDALVSAGASLETWASDGATTITMKSSVALGGAALDVTPIDRDGDGKPEVAALLGSGKLVLLGNSMGSLIIADQQTGPPTAFRVFGGDLDGDGKGDVLLVGSDGATGILESP